MPVQFSTIHFVNRSPDLTLTIEAPIGSFLLTEPIARDAARDFTVNLADCPSTRLHVTSTSHPDFDQTFAIAPPDSGRPSYLKTLRVLYHVGDFEGVFEGSTEILG
ncbi:hypothetical protein NKH95_01680 [Mesorhizobium sp. M0848]|uniref:hypothetical protein n=1 Tax=Mesorhizobium sp. M0848 TaxID=2957012 RepID=UPI00333BBD2B